MQERSKYKNLTEDNLRKIIEEAMYSKDAPKVVAYTYEPERGLIPIEESKSFHRAMKQHVLNYQVGETVKIVNLTIVDRHYYTITKIEYEDFHLRRTIKGGGYVSVVTTIDNIERYDKKIKHGIYR